MGNTESFVVSRNDDENNYNIDAEAIGKDYASTVQNVQTPIDMRYNKMYIVYQRINGVSKTFALSIKMIDDNIFVYVTDTDTEKTILAHVSKIDIDPSNRDHNVAYYMKYIQISRDFKLISLPESGRVNVYDLTKLLNRNVLHLVNSVGIVLKQDSNGVMRSGIEIDVGSTSTTMIMSSFKQTESTGSPTDRLGTVNFRYIDCNSQPYKCVLCKDLFIVVCADYNRLNKVVAIDYTNKKVHEIKNLNLDLNRSAMRFSTNGRFISLYDSPKNTLSLCDMSESNPELKSLPLQINSETILDTMCISDDGRFLFYIEGDMKFHIYDVPRKMIYDLDPKVQMSKEQTKSIKFHLMDYSRYSSIIKLNHATECDNLYILVGWNRKNTSAAYWLIRCSNTGYSVMGPSLVDMPVNGQIEYIYNNGYMFIYKTTSGITVYDLNKVIPIRFAGMLAANVKEQLNEYYKRDYPSKRDTYYNSVEIIGADDSKQRYNLNDYIMYLFSMVKPTVSGVETNVYQLRVNANINIYGTTKSFDLFQDLLIGRINQTDILTNIFSIKGEIGRHNMMYELMLHFYEYTRVIALKETASGDLDRSGFSNLKALYIGCILLVLVLKYYSMVVKTKVGTTDSTVGRTSKAGDIIRSDIKEMYNTNFPAFEGFVDRSIKVIIGETI
jgi:hypothetical protein